MTSVFSSLFDRNNYGNDATRHVGLGVETNNEHGSASTLFMSSETGIGLNFLIFSPYM